MREMTTAEVTFEYLNHFAGVVLPIAFARSVVAPIDRVKLLLQTQDVNPKIVRKADVKFKGIIDCFRRVLFEQGARAFWRGNLTRVLSSSIEHISTSLMREDIRRLIPRYNPREDFLKALVSKMAFQYLPAAAGHLVAYPLDYAQLRLASDIGRGQPSFKGIVDCIIKTIQTGGVLSLYRGFAVSLFAVIHRRGIQQGWFHTISGKNPFRNEKGVLGYLSKFSAAQICAISAHFAVHPLDTVYHRLQMESDLPKASRKYSGFFDCCHKIYCEETVLGFYKGALANAVLRTVSSSAAIVFYYEMRSRFRSDDRYH